MSSLTHHVLKRGSLLICLSVSLEMSPGPGKHQRCVCGKACHSTGAHSLKMDHSLHKRVFLELLSTDAFGVKKVMKFLPLQAGFSVTFVVFNYMTLMNL